MDGSEQGERERGGGGDRDRDRHRQTDRERETDIQTERQTDRLRNRQTGRDRHTQQRETEILVTTQDHIGARHSTHNHKSNPLFVCTSHVISQFMRTRQNEVE